MAEQKSAVASDNASCKKMSLPAEYKFDRYLLAFSLLISGVFVFLAMTLGILDDNWSRYSTLNYLVSKPFLYVGFAFFGYHLLFRDKGPSGKLTPIDVMFRRIVSIMILVYVVVPPMLYGFAQYDIMDVNENLVKVAWIIEGISMLVIGLLLWMIYWGSTAQGSFLPLPTKAKGQLVCGMPGLMRFLMSIFVMVWGVFGFLFNTMLVSKVVGPIATITSGIKAIGFIAGLMYLVFTVFLLLEMLSEEVEVISSDDLEKLAAAKKEAKERAAAAEAKRKAEEQAKKAQAEAKAAEERAKAATAQANR